MGRMETDPHDLVVRTIREHASALLRTARRHSLCADDAHDAYQRALEIFLRRASTLEPDTAVRWLLSALTRQRSRPEFFGVEPSALVGVRFRMRIRNRQPEPEHAGGTCGRHVPAGNP
jgi:hypothetical protein